MVPPTAAEVNNLLQRITIEYKEGCRIPVTSRDPPAFGIHVRPLPLNENSCTSAPCRFWELAVDLASELNFCKDSSLNLCSSVDHDSRHCLVIPQPFLPLSLPLCPVLIGHICHFQVCTAHLSWSTARKRQGKRPDECFANKRKTWIF